MKHPDLESLLRWLINPAETEEEVVAHLASPCSICAEKLEELAGCDALLAAAGNADTADPVAAATVERAVNALVEVLESWRVDRVRGQQSPGSRGPGDESARAFRGEGYDATVRVRGDAGRGGSIRGRLLLGAAPEATEIFLTRGGEPRRETRVDRHGRFRLDGVEVGQYELRFFTSDQREIIMQNIEVAPAAESSAPA